MGSSSKQISLETDQIVSVSLREIEYLCLYTVAGKCNTVDPYKENEGVKEAQLRAMKMKKIISSFFRQHKSRYRLQVTMSKVHTG